MWLTFVAYIKFLLDSTGIVYITGKQGTFSNGNMPLKEHSEESLDIWMYKLNKKRERKIDHVLSYVVGIQYLKKEEQEFQINCFNLIMLEMNLNLNSEPWDLRRVFETNV